MTGNITIHDAAWALICGDITFSLNFKREKYRLSIGDGIYLTQLDLAFKQNPRRATREEVLDLIRQGDVAMWTWPTFMAMWQGFAAGIEAGKRFARKQAGSD